MELPITFAHFTLHLQALTPIHLPLVSGATLRGGFGYTFKQLVCVVDHRDCARCLLRSRCAYPYVFETPPPPDTSRLRKYPFAPHPFVLTPPPGNRTYAPGEHFSAELVLVGRGMLYLPYFIYTLSKLGQKGLGRERGQYILREVLACTEEGTRVSIYTAESQQLQEHYPILRGDLFTGDGIEKQTLRLRFITPTRIKYQGHYQYDLPFHVLIRTLLRRLSLLTYFHCGIELELDFQGLITRSMAIETVQSSLQWIEQPRYSTRQQTAMSLGGILGEVTYQGNFREFLSLLRLGVYLHVGKTTSFGHGKYRIEEEG